MRVNARAEAVEALQRRLGHAFTDKGLLERALTHSSVAPDARNKRRDNERLDGSLPDSAATTRASALLRDVSIFSL